jgi:hypothetical protein
MTHRHALATVATAAALCLALPAQAVKYGTLPSTEPGAAPVVNPFTGKQTDVWKLVGRTNTGCTSFQITREWVVAASHCPNDPASAKPFTNHLGASTLADCAFPPNGSDYQICRLKNPAALTAMPMYPALAVAPRWAVTENLKYGSLMGYGHSNEGDGLAFVGFNGLPFGYEPAKAPNTPNIPHTVGGDSGGAAYWFPANGTDPVMVGVLVSGGTLQTSPLFFAQADLNWIRDTIVQHGDAAPALRTTDQVFSSPVGGVPPELTAKPAVSAATGGGVLVKWNTPGASPGVSSFDVTLGKGGAIDRTQSVSVWAAKSLTFTNLAAEQYTICVRPRNSMGASSAADARLFTPDGPTSGWFVEVETPNCSVIDNRATQTTVSGIMATVGAPFLGSYKVSFNWPAPALIPQDVALGGYRVNYSITSSTGAIKTSSATVTTLGSSISATKGAKVCAAVAATTRLGQVGPLSAANCVIIK